MEDKNVKISCWSSKGNSTGTVEKVSTCFICNGKTQEVKSITVKHFVLDDLVDKVQEDTYHMCLNENCDVVYYNSEQNIVFKISDMKIPIWFKKDTDPKYICYCNKVTEEQIIDAVINNGAKNIRDIVNITGAMKNSNCEINNPLGKCCSAVIQETINKVMKNKS